MLHINEKVKVTDLARKGQLHAEVTEIYGKNDYLKS